MLFDFRSDGGPRLGPGLRDDGFGLLLGLNDKARGIVAKPLRVCFQFIRGGGDLAGGGLGIGKLRPARLVTCGDAGADLPFLGF